MATTIQNFFTRAAAKQFSRDFLFRVRQIDLIGGISFNGEDDLVYARTASLPGRNIDNVNVNYFCLLYTSPSPRDISGSRMPSSA